MRDVKKKGRSEKRGDRRKVRKGEKRGTLRTDGNVTSGDTSTSQNIPKFGYQVQSSLSFML